MGEQGQMLSVTSSQHDGAVVVSLTGELDMTTVGPASTALTQALHTDTTLLILDLTGLSFFSSAGLNLLLQLHQDAQHHGREIRLAGNHRVVTRPLELTGLADLFPLYPTLSQALTPTTA
jgi:anti-sigma B factor antagonist